MLTIQAAVLADLNGRAERSGQARLNRAILRLACGLRVSEIAGLRMADVCLAGPRPHMRIRACVAKGGRSRRVPLWWDAGTLADLVAWQAERVAQGGRDADPFICSVQAHHRGLPLQGQAHFVQRLRGPVAERRLRGVCGRQVISPQAHDGRGEGTAAL